MGGGFYLFRDFGCRKVDGLFGWDYLSRMVTKQGRFHAMRSIDS